MINPDDLVEDIPIDLVLAITSNDTLLHVGSSSGVVAHLLQPAFASQPEIETLRPLSGAFAPHAVTPARVRADPNSSIQLFDASGARMTIRRTRKAGELQAVYPPDVVPEERLLARISVALDNMQAVLNESPELGNDGPTQHTEVPRPTGSLVDVLTELYGLFDPLDPSIQSNRGNWLHNLAHAAGLA